MRYFAVYPAYSVVRRLGNVRACYAFGFLEGMGIHAVVGNGANPFGIVNTILLYSNSNLY